jgi:hypothetical protein
MSQYEISTDRSRLDIALVHDFLRSSYWAAGIPRAIVERSNIERKPCLILLAGGETHENAFP